MEGEVDGVIVGVDVRVLDGEAPLLSESVIEGVSDREDVCEEDIELLCD